MISTWSVFLHGARILKGIPNSSSSLRQYTIPQSLPSIMSNSRYLCTAKPQSTDDIMEKPVKSTSQNQTERESLSAENISIDGDMKSKYAAFDDSQSEVIYDVYEEREKARDRLLAEDAIRDPFEGISLHRGVHGVFDIEDIVDLLHHENGKNVFVAEVPKRMKYVDYIVMTTAKSTKHMNAIAQFVRKVYKKKRSPHDVIPALEGESSSQNWMALDLGNIALHIFTEGARRLYDIDMLWAVGANYDDEVNKEDALANILAKHSVTLDQLQPAS